jgi:transcriptional regulator with XRE-family HTH domain
MDSLGKRLRHLRRVKNISQEKLASLVGLSTGAIGAYEVDRTYPSVAVLVKISTEFQVSIDWLIKGEEAPKEAQSEESQELTSLLRILEEKEKQISDLSNALINISKLVKLKVADYFAAFCIPNFPWINGNLWLQDESVTKRLT